MLPTGAERTPPPRLRVHLVARSLLYATASFVFIAAFSFTLSFCLFTTCIRSSADIMNQKPAKAWELYLKMETSADSYSLLQLIANDCYRVHYFCFFSFLCSPQQTVICVLALCRWDNSSTRRRHSTFSSASIRVPTIGRANAAPSAAPFKWSSPAARTSAPPTLNLNIFLSFSVHYKYSASDIRVLHSLHSCFLRTESDYVT